MLFCQLQCPTLVVCGLMLWLAVSGQQGAELLVLVKVMLRLLLLAAARAVLVKVVQH